MRRRLPLNLALAAAVAALAVVFLLDRPEDAPETPITGLDREAVKTAAIHFPDAETIRLERGEEGWRLRAPVEARAEDSTVSQILRLAERSSQRGMKASEVDTAEIGLDPPRRKVVLDDVTIELGDVQPIGNRRYARVGDTVHLIDEPNMRALDSDYANLVARKLLPDDAELTRLELPDITLTPTEQGGWAVAPESADRGADAAQKTIDAWRRTRALSLETAEDGEAAGRVEIETADHGTIVFEILEREPQLLLRRPDIGVTLHVAGNRAAPLLEMRHPEPAGDEGAPSLKRQPDVQLESDADG